MARNEQRTRNASAGQEKPVGWCWEFRESGVKIAGKK